MITRQHLASINRADRDLYAREKVLNSAIIAADISSGWEEYLQILDAFYADHVVVSDGIESGSVFGRERIPALLLKFLVPIHVMAEIGGLSVLIRESPILGDTADETHSAWSVDLIGVSGRTCQICWCIFDDGLILAWYTNATTTTSKPAASNLRRSSSESVIGKCGRSTAVLAGANLLCCEISTGCRGGSQCQAPPAPY
jgi:hypothetical protein